MTVLFISGLTHQAKTALEIISKDAVRSYATVAFLRVTKDSVTLTATDGYTLFTSTVKQQNDNVPIDAPVSVVVPIDAVKFLSKKGSSIRIELDSLEIHMDKLTTKVSSVKYPAYERLLNDFLDSPADTEPLLMDPQFLGIARHMPPSRLKQTKEGIALTNKTDTLIILAMKSDQ